MRGRDLLKCSCCLGPDTGIWNRGPLCTRHFLCCLKVKISGKGGERFKWIPGLCDCHINVRIYLATESIWYDCVTVETGGGEKGDCGLP